MARKTHIDKIMKIVGLIQFIQKSRMPTRIYHLKTMSLHCIHDMVTIATSNSSCDRMKANLSMRYSYMLC